MKNFIKIFIILLWSSLFYGINSFASGIHEFVIMVQTDNEGTSENNEFTIPINPLYTYDYGVDCDGDGIYELKYQEGNVTCSYRITKSPPPRRIAITGTFPVIYFNGKGDKEKLLEVVQWGTNQWKSMSGSFRGTSNLTVTASDNPDLSKVKYMSYMFDGATNLTFTHSINDWDVSLVEHTGGMFKGAESFNQDIGDWNVSNVEAMGSMFKSAHSFNQDIGSWDVSGVKDMSWMFWYAVDFNQDIGNWDVSGVFTMRNMFLAANSFNQDIGNWDVSGVSNMSYMLHGADSFSQDISTWNVSGTVDFSYMLDATNLSISNYDNLLKAWSKLNLANDRHFTVRTSQYCQGEEARTLMESEADDSWTFNDGGKNCDFYIITANKVSVKSGEKSVINVDANIGEGEDVLYFIVGGADQNKFTITENGVLEFNDAQDVNTPTDKNGDNVYRVQVKAENQGYTTDYQTIQVTVESDEISALVPVISYLLF